MNSVRNRPCGRVGEFRYPAGAFFRLLALFCTAALIVFSGGCNGAVSETSSQLYAMDTFVTVKAYGDEAEDAAAAAAARLRDIEDMLSVTKPESDIYKINASGGGEVNVSEETAALISRALGACRKTGGALDITIYPVLREWGFTTGNYRVPSDGEIASALETVGYERISVSGCTVTVPTGGMIDLGSCAKGYAGDEMIGELRRFGVTSAIVNLGGNVQTLGVRPDGSDWTVGIADPFAPSELIGTLRSGEAAVVTSGGYRRYFTDDDGKAYIHIIDPSTGRPAGSGLAGVTVIGASGFLCDALSTALFVKGKTGAVGYWRENGGFEMILVTDDGTVSVTPGIAARFKCREGVPCEVIGASDEQ